MKHRNSLPVLCIASGFCLLLFASMTGMLQADTNATPASTSASADLLGSTNTPGEPMLTLKALEQLRRDIEATTARNSAALTSGIAMLGPTLDRLHERQMGLVQTSNKTILIVAGIFAGVGFIALMSIVLILMRALGRFAEIAGNPNRSVVMTARPAIAALGVEDLVNVNATAVEQASERFQHAIEHLQKRIFELEHSAQPAAALESGKPSGPVISAHNISPLLAHDTAPKAPPDVLEVASRASLLLGKGQALLNLDQADQALACFDEILAVDPNNTEALLRRGLSLEKLENWEMALESYDRALGIDSSLTVAYLYKGGVCNKLQRHREALDSYEHALHTEKRSRAS